VSVRSRLAAGLAAAAVGWLVAGPAAAGRAGHLPLRPGPPVTDLLWVPGTLRAAGLGVAEVPGWRARGHPGPFHPQAVVVHHDASGAGPSPGTVGWLAAGFRSGTDRHYDAQLWVDTAGTWHVVAAGLAQHAGPGAGWGAVPPGGGNEYALGVETDHTAGEAWPPALLSSLARGLAALCAARGWDPATRVMGHREYAPGRKQDPAGLDMDRLRRAVAAAARDLGQR